MAENDVLNGLAVTTEEHLRQLCSISSESGNAEGIRGVADLISRQLTRHGLRVEIVEEPDANGRMQPVLFARGPKADGSHLLLLGHMDTVLPAVAPEREGDRLFATGSLDMKGGLAMLLGALDLLSARGEKVPDDLLLVLMPDEESESFISGAFTTKWSRDARLVLVLEPGQVCDKGETLVAGRRGLTEWTTQFTGRGAHSGLAYWHGRSALVAAADWCLRAAKLSQRGAGPTVNVARIVGGGGDFVHGLESQFDLVGTSRQLNVVSDAAIAEGEIRFLTSKDGAATMEALAQLATSVAAEHEVTASFTPGMMIAPVDPHGPGASYIQRTVELAGARGFHLEVEEDRGGISFPNFLADPAKTPVIDGLGPTGDGMHVRGEYLNLESLRKRTVLLADLLAEL